jgi:hypothetical protein
LIASVLLLGEASFVMLIIIPIFFPTILATHLTVVIGGFYFILVKGSCSSFLEITANYFSLTRVIKYPNIDEQIFLLLMFSWKIFDLLYFNKKSEDILDNIGPKTLLSAIDSSVNYFVNDATNYVIGYPLYWCLSLLVVFQISMTYFEDKSFLFREVVQTFSFFLLVFQFLKKFGYLTADSVSTLLELELLLICPFLVYFSGGTDSPFVPLFITFPIQYDFSRKVNAGFMFFALVFFLLPDKYIELVFQNHEEYKIHPYVQFAFYFFSFLSIAIYKREKMYNFYTSLFESNSPAVLNGHEIFIEKNIILGKGASSCVFRGQYMNFDVAVKQIILKDGQNRGINLLLVFIIASDNQVFQK